MTATLETGDGRSTLRFERVLAHPRARVWRAVTDPDELAQWFPSAVVYEPRVGAPMQFDFGGAHDIDAWPGEVLAWEPERVFAFAWGTDQLRFELADTADGGTRLVFTHAFAHEPGKEARDAAGWEACLAAFGALLESRPKPGPDAWSGYAATYAERFGELTVDGDEGSRVVRLQGPYAEVGGRPAVNVDTGVLVVSERGRALEDGAPVELRAGTVAEPGEPIASGVLRDPLAGVAQAIR